MRKRIAILGSTGSIGTQALKVIAAHPDKFEIEILTANNNARLLIEQAIVMQPNAVVIANDKSYHEVADALAQHPIKVYAGDKALEQVVQFETVDIVLSALVGYSGLLPTIKAIEAGKVIAMANKETLVAAGELVMQLAAQHCSPIIPVDSEHSAIFQCLVGELSAVEKIYLTASGGPFLDTPTSELSKVTKNQALKHPCWAMGSKITIDSASMMNKGFEVIEAHWLFNIPADKIEVIIHPQSIIHSMVQFEDGSIKAQMGLPDMRLPIQYAFTFPKRDKMDTPRLNFAKHPQLTFREPDMKKFRNLAIAYQALRQGGNVACAVNAANEVAVAAFLQNRIIFTQMSDLIEKTIEHTAFIAKPTLDDYIQTNAEACRLARELISTMK
ncbi:MAG: 1-deoxy-D-xylulose-5-phosphate reductoisomerase [Prevotellaceae bacterium]|jgi:1-deoxy-D-xylulose-5-phosphate reductoisomerase|nr:1-deoxy-D-xylulose-5-phosphate reductoisomerase [Prevotellaceae bacterium]